MSYRNYSVLVIRCMHIYVKFRNVCLQESPLNTKDMAGSEENLNDDVVHEEDDAEYVTDYTSDNEGSTEKQEDEVKEEVHVTKASINNKKDSRKIKYFNPIENSK